MNNNFGTESVVEMTNKIKLKENNIYTKEEVEANVNTWLEALESGKYKQGKNYLVKDNKFCCLGVACDITDAEYKMKEYVGDGWAREYDGLCGVPPYSIKAAFGLTERYGLIDPHDSRSLANENDAGATFERIARLIRSQPTGLFVYTDLNLK